MLVLRPHGADVPGTIAATGPAERRILATTAGETRTVRLADGSTVRLDAATRLDAAFDAERRTIRLSQGQARFAVAHETRPFVVLAGGGSVTARGTMFDVAVAGGRVDVRLLEGAVDVVLPARARQVRPTVRRLTPGEGLSFTPAPAADIASAAGARDVEAVPVAALVAEANRSASRPDPTGRSRARTAPRVGTLPPRRHRPARRAAGGALRPDRRPQRPPRDRAARVIAEFFRMAAP